MLKNPSIPCLFPPKGGDSMSTVIKKHILYLLEHYNQMRAEIDTLKFELKNLNRMRDVEMIEALTFSSSRCV